MYPKITSDNLLNLYIIDSDAAKGEILNALARGNYEKINKPFNRLNDVDKAEIINILKDNGLIE